VVLALQLAVAPVSPRAPALSAVLCLALAGACSPSALPEADPDAAPPAGEPDASAVDPAAARSGCADGMRDGFLSIEASPDIAACAGGWSEPGLLTSIEPACARAAGDDGDNPSGEGCNVADLCAEGWHVCVGAAEVGARSGGSCAAATADPAVPVFFATRQSGPGAAECGDGGENDLFGCGSLGAAVTQPSCAPLDRFSNDLCQALGAPWSCGADGTREAREVTKPSPEAGGVLCCRNGPLFTSTTESP